MSCISSLSLKKVPWFHYLCSVVVSASANPSVVLSSGSWEVRPSPKSVVLHSIYYLEVNLKDILNFGRKTGRKTGPNSKPNSVLGHYKFRHVSKLQKWPGPGFGPDSGPTKMSIELHPWLSPVAMIVYWNWLGSRLMKNPCPGSAANSGASAGRSCLRVVSTITFSC